MFATRVQCRSGTFASRKTPFRAARIQCNAAFKLEHAASALVAAGLLLSPAPALASGPQGSDSASMEAELARIIEARTGKAEALPELLDVPKGEVTIATPKKAAPALAAVEAPVVAPMAPAVVEPPPPVPSTPAQPAPAAVAKEAPSAGLQTRADSTSAPAAGGNNGLLVGGAVALLGVVAAAAIANNSGEQAPAIAATAPAATAEPGAAAPPAAAEGAAEGATAAVDGGSAPSS